LRMELVWHFALLGFGIKAKLPLPRLLPLPNFALLGFGIKAKRGS